MRLEAVFCAALFAAGGGFPQSAAPPSTTRQQIESHSRQAQEFLAKGQPDLAVREYKAILKLDPSNVDARGNLGVTLFFQGDYEDAAAHLRTAVKQQPDLWKIQVLLGMSEKRIGQPAAAQADLEKSLPHIQEEKLRIEAGMELAEVYYAAGALDKAASVMGMLRQVAPENTEVLYTAYRVYSDLAGETMLSMAMLAPNSARMHQIMGQQMARQGNIEGAIAHYREAIKADPHLPGLRFELAEALNLRNSATDQQEVEKEYRAALADNPFDEKSECRLGDIALRASNSQEALAHYQRAVELQPNDADAYLGLGRVLTQVQRTAEAEQYLKRAAQIEPFSAITHYRMALVYRATGRAAEAQKELAEFQRLKDMKERLKQVYEEMRLQPVKQEHDVDGGR